ncbi:MAG: RHS repeat domain-containing protein [Achromobacter sp.]|uniref:RHS repeat domain-containing protein n=1 Tax=Achromobacter sp. TaxID=134375 RepID=UPI003D02E93E
MTFEEQPANFQYPTNIIRTFRDASGSRSEQEEMSYDRDGRLISHRQRNGIFSTWQYYDVQGEDGCPADPSGLGQYVNTMTIYPRPGPNPAPVRQLRYTYTKLDAGGRLGDVDHPVPYGIFPLAIEERADGTVIRRTEMQYVNALGSPDHGRVRSTTDSIFSPGQAAKITVRHWRYAYDVHRSEISVEQTLIGFDGKSLKVSEGRCLYTGRLIWGANAQGVRTQYVYDQCGRETKRVEAAGSAYERVWRTDYSLYTREGSTSRLLSITTRSPSGVELRDLYDGLGRQVAREYRVNESWFLLGSADYDAQGRLTAVVRYDELPDGAGSVRPITGSVIYFYDAWGLPAGFRRAGAGEVRFSHDIVALRTRETRPGISESVLRHYDPESFCLSKEQRLDGNDREVSVTSFDYDGLDRIVSKTDALGGIEHYVYDVFGRLDTSIQTDGTRVRRSHEMIGRQEVVSVLVNETLLGVQNFDGLQRITQVRSGGRVTQLAYRGSAVRPDVVIKPDGRRLEYAYIAELGNSVSRCADNGSELSQGFKYAGPCGVMVAATQDELNGAQSRLELSYDAWGRIARQQSYLASDVVPVRSVFTYSIGGLPLSEVIADGPLRIIAYDQYGRTTGCTVGDLVLGASYDDYGRLSGWRIEDGDRAQQTTLSFDGFDREIRRETAYSKSGLRLVIEQDWDKNDALHARRTYVNGDLLREETYGYDERTRLVTYACTGRELPTDVHGKRLQSQTFKYDALSNIRSVGTVFEGGEDEATYGFDNSEDPCQLTWIRHTHADYPAYAELRYDAAGRMVRDERGRQLSYDAFGRLTSVSGADGAISYAYDAMDVLRLRTGSNGTRRELYYQNGTVSAVLDESGAVTSFLRIAGQVLAQRRSDAKTLLLATDVKSSVVAVESEDASSVLGYTPYGYRAADAQGALLGYNGELLDGEVGYHLGNGYRVYSPTLMRFTSPDAWSPFGAGGVNAYAYCEGDPINRSDPSGHLSTKAWIQVGLTVAFALLGLFGGVVMLGAARGLGTILAISAIGLNLASEASQLVSVVSGATASPVRFRDANGSYVIQADRRRRVSKVTYWISLALAIAGSFTSVGALYVSRLLLLGRFNRQFGGEDDRDTALPLGSASVASRTVGLVSRVEELESKPLETELNNYEASEEEQDEIPESPHLPEHESEREPGEFRSPDLYGATSADQQQAAMRGHYSPAWDRSDIFSQPRVDIRDGKPFSLAAGPSTDRQPFAPPAKILCRIGRAGPPGPI